MRSYTEGEIFSVTQAVDPDLQVVRTSIKAVQYGVGA